MWFYLIEQVTHSSTFVQTVCVYIIIMVNASQIVSYLQPT